MGNLSDQYTIMNTTKATPDHHKCEFAAFRLSKFFVPSATGVWGIVPQRAFGSFWPLQKELAARRNLAPHRLLAKASAYLLKTTPTYWGEPKMIILVDVGHHDILKQFRNKGSTHRQQRAAFACSVEIIYCKICLSASPISPSIQMDCLAISRGATASPILIHAYTACGFSSVRCQKGYFIQTGVLLPTPNSR